MEYGRKNMLIFLDTEFTGLDQDRPDLISIGLVDENGREFYAELPIAHYTMQCNEWVHFNVLPHLWGGNHVQSLEHIRGHLTVWIESLQDQAIIVTDCPGADFALFVQLLQEWPKNLAKYPMPFSVWSMGDDQQPVLEKLMDNYYTTNRPKHHALHDANALRLGLQYAVKNGWTPDSIYANDK